MASKLTGERRKAFLPHETTRAAFPSRWNPPETRTESSSRFMADPVRARRPRSSSRALARTSRAKSLQLAPNQSAFPPKPIPLLPCSWSGRPCFRSVAAVSDLPPPLPFLPSPPRCSWSYAPWRCPTEGEILPSPAVARQDVAAAVPWKAATAAWRRAAVVTWWRAAAPARRRAAVVLLWRLRCLRQPQRQLHPHPCWPGIGTGGSSAHSSFPQYANPW